MTQRVVAAVEAFVIRWAPPDKRAEMIKDLGKLIEVAVKECTEYMDGGIN